ncbi:type II secretion system protein GspM [Bordetella sp. LUAb4]|uniref:type II secretion system protein GspM n=1 Tax=Bordetella sp. LUAb4 TaxID=2843195 RepID=UPI001E50B040|nr:type II secretion system protein GspM [Bordetella sp. LUAb4]
MKRPDDKDVSVPANAGRQSARGPDTPPAPVRGLAPTFATWRLKLRDALRPVAAWHAALTPRERRLVDVGGIVLALFLVFTFAIDPALTTIARSRNELPALRAQAAAVASLTNEAQRLRQHGGRTSNAPLAQTDIDESLRRAGFAPDSWRITQEVGNGNGGGNGNAGKPAVWRVELKQAPSTALMRWSDNVPAELRLRVANVELIRASTEYGRPIPGKVNGTVRLAASVGN